MPTFLDIDDFQCILEAPDAARRAGMARRLYADFEAGALDAFERRAALSIFRSIVRDDEQAVRHDFARFVSRSRILPDDLAASIASDRAPRVAAPFLKHAIGTSEDVLVDAVGSGTPWRQSAVAARAHVPKPVAAAIAEVAEAPAVLALLRNPGAVVGPAAVARIADRFADDDDIADLLLGRPGVPGGFVEARIHTISGRLKAFVDHTGWLRPEIAEEAVANAVEHSLVDFAVGRSVADLAPIFAKWRAEGRITRGFVLRAACYGALSALRLSLGHVAGLPEHRVEALWTDRRGYGRQSLISRAGFSGDEAAFIHQSVARFAALPANVSPSVRTAVMAEGIDAVMEDGGVSEGLAELIGHFAADAGGASPPHATDAAARAA